MATRRIGVGDFIVTPAMERNIAKVLATGRISYGPLSREFETRFAALHESNFAVLSNSGTSSLQIALQALKEIHNWKDGDEVLVPAVTFVASVNVILHNRLTPILIDVEPQYYGMDLPLIEERITHKTRAILPVHLFGMPCDMRSISQMAHYHQLYIVEDSCECMFAMHRDRSVGAWGDIGCFSTYVAHLLTTGVGGIATTNNPDYAAKMRSLVNHGRDGIYVSIDDDNDLDSDGLREVILRRFNFESIGHSYRITELEAAIGLAQLENWRENIQKRQENAAYLYAGLAHLDQLQLPEIRPYTTHSFMMFPILLKQGDKWDLCNHLESHGIETREMMRLTDQPCYSGMWDVDDYPVAKRINEQGFYIGCHPGLTRDDLDYIIEILEGYFK